MAEFAFNNKVHIVTKMSPFKTNYGREPRMGFDIRKKGKNIKVEEFVKEMKDRHKKAKAALVKLQEEMKKQADRNRKEAEEYRVGNKVLISTKDFPMELMKRATKKMTEKYRTICGQENYIRECGRIGVTSVVQNTPGGECKKNGEV